jgi:DNA repair protein RadC
MTDSKPDHLGHFERLRERFIMSPEGFHDYELLELLLTHVIRGHNVKPAAKELIKRFGSIAGVLDAPKDQLESINGIKEKSAILILLVKRLFEAYAADQIKKRDVLSSPDAVIEFARIKTAGLPHEAFMVIYLNVKNHVIAHDVINEGTVDHAVVYPRRVVESALAHHAASLILVHNHPSGDPTPSSEDKRLTRSIVEAARTMDIRVVDHIIVGKAAHFSFHEHHLLNG